MTDEHTLFATLLLLYVLECAAWAPRGAVAFVARAADRATLALPSRTFGNLRGGLVLGRLWPPVRGTFIVPQWPVSLGPKGVLAWVSQSVELAERPSQPATYRSFGDLRRIHTDDRVVLLGEQVVLTAASDRLARAVAEAIRKLRDCPEDKREATIAQLLEHHGDASAVRQRLSELARETDALRAGGLMLAALMFGIMPAAVVRFGLERTWFVLLAGLYLVTWTVAFLFYRAHLRLLPQAQADRIGRTVLVALFPISALRAPDLIARQFLHGFHPFAVAAVVLDKEALTTFAAHLLRDAYHPRRPIGIHDNPEANEVETFHREAMKKELVRRIRDAGLDPGAMLLPPKPEDSSIRSYCPRCVAQYAHPEGVCEDCGGVPLLGIPTDGAESAGKSMRSGGS